MRVSVLLPCLLVAGCATPPPPPPPSVSVQVPDSRYCAALIPGRQGGAAWRPAANEHVLALDGQRCVYWDLRLRCRTPPPSPPISTAPVTPAPPFTGSYAPMPVRVTAQDPFQWSR